MPSPNILIYILKKTFLNREALYGNFFFFFFKVQDWREQTKTCKRRLYLPETKLERPLNAYWNEYCKYSPGCRCWLPQLNYGEKKRGESRVWKMRGWVSWMLLNQMSTRNMQKIRKCSIYKLQWMLFMLHCFFLQSCSPGYVDWIGAICQSSGEVEFVPLPEVWAVPVCWQSPSWSSWKPQFNAHLASEDNLEAHPGEFSRGLLSLLEGSGSFNCCLPVFSGTNWVSACQQAKSQCES